MTQPAVTLARAPLFLDLAGKRRTIKFNFLSVAALQEANALGKDYAEAIDSDESGARKLRVNYRNLLIYLWAALQSDFERTGEPLSIEELADAITPDMVSEVLRVVGKAVAQYYSVGKSQAAGEPAAPAAEE